MLVEGDEFPTTGQVNPYAFSQAISRAQEAGDDVVILALSSKLSGTHQSAVTAASQADGSTEVYVVDTKSVTVGQHILVDYALRLVEEGRPAAEVAAAVEVAADRVCLVALLDTLEYLKRGGRISAAAGTLGEMLSIKPVITVADGEVAILGKARGSKNGRNLLRQQLESAGGIDFDMPVMDRLSPVFPISSCASTLRTAAPCGRAALPSRTFPRLWSVRQSVRMSAPVPLRWRTSRRHSVLSNDVSFAALAFGWDDPGRERGPFCHSFEQGGGLSAPASGRMEMFVHAVI